MPSDMSQFKLPSRADVPEEMRAQFEAFFKSKMGDLLSEVNSEVSPDDALFRDELAGSPLEVKSSPQRGRGLYATRDIKAGELRYVSLKLTSGETLLNTRPLVSVLSKPQLYEPPAGQKMELHCNGCYLLKPVQRCSGCKGVYYCGAACQQADWANHKTECKALKRVRQLWVQSYPDEARDGLNNSWVQAEGARALGLLCWARKAHRDAHGRDPAYWPKVAKMYSDGPDMGSGAHDVPAADQMAVHLSYYVGAAEPPTDPNNLDLIDMERYGFSDDELTAFVRSFVLNAFTLSSFDLKPIGVAMSPLLALFNHSCAPNAAIVFPRGGKEMCAVANADIAAGEEVLTTYVDISDDRATRQGDLQSRYGFECECPACTLDAVDPRNCLLHPGCGGVGAMPDLRQMCDAARVVCEACGGAWTVSPNALRALVNEGLALVSAEDRGALAPSDLGRVADVIARLEKAMPPSSRPLLRLHTVAKNLHVPAAQPPALAHALKALAGAQKVYPRNHPSVALLRAESANLAAQIATHIAQYGPGISEHDIKARIADLRAAADDCDRALGKRSTVAESLRGFAHDMDVSLQAC